MALPAPGEASGSAKARVHALAPPDSKALMSSRAQCFCLLARLMPARQHISARSLVAATAAEYRTGSSSLAASRQPPQRPHRRTMLLLSLPAWLLRRCGPCSGKRRRWPSTANAERGLRPLNPPRIEAGQGSRAATLCLLLASACAGAALQANRKPAVCVISS